MQQVHSAALRRSLSGSLLVGNVDEVPNRGLLTQRLFHSRPVGTRGLIQGEEPGSGTQRDMQPGRCVDFDGTDDFIHAGSIGNYTDNFTISAWIKTTKLGSRIAARRDGSGSQYDFYLNDATGRLALYCSPGPFVSGNIEVTSGTWFHVALVIQGTASRFYVNGVADGSPFSAAGITAIAADYHIGALGTLGAGYLDGKMFDHRLYNVALTAAEVFELYTLKANALPNKPAIAHYKLDDFNLHSVLDSSGNSNHAAATNVTTTIGSFFYEGQDVPFSWHNDKGYNLGICQAASAVSWGTAGFRSRESFDGDGYLEFRLQELSSLFIGLSATDPNVNYSSIDYALWINDSYTGIFENGSVITTSLRVVDLAADGNLFRIERVGTAVHYYVNGVLIHTSGVPSSGSLFVDAASIYQYSTSSILLNGRPITFDKITGMNAFYAPRDERDKTQDIFGDPLFYSGKCPRNAQLIQSHCLTFGPSNNHVAVTTDATTSDGEFTYACWVKPKVDPLNWRTIFAHTNYEFALYIYNQRLNLYDASNTTFPTVLEAGKWHHVAITRDAANLVRVFINGVCERTTVTWTRDVVGDHTLRLGADAFAATGLDTGLCDFQAYGEQLSEAQILQIMQAGACSVTPYHHFPLSEGQDAYVDDIGSAGAVGTLTNATLATAWGATQSVFHHNAARGFDLVTRFDAVNTYLDSGLTMNGWTEFTVWRRARYTTAFAAGLYRLDGFVNTDASSRARLGLSGAADGFLWINYGTGTDYTFAQTIPVGRWHTLAITSQAAGNGQTFYNAAVIHTQALAAYSIANTHNFYIGASNDFGTPSWKSAYDLSEYRIYNRALTPAELTYLESDGRSGTNPTTSHLVFHIRGNPDPTQRVIHNLAGSDKLLVGPATEKAMFKRIAAKVHGTSILGRVPTHPAGAYLNGAESSVDLTQEVSAPEVIGLETAWNPNGFSLTAPQIGLADVSWGSVTGEVTRTNNQAADPESGFQTATRIIETTGAPFHYVGQLVAGGPRDYIIQVTAKALGRSWIAVQLNATTTHMAYFNIGAGVTGTEINSTAQAVELGDGWTLCTLRATTTSNLVYVNVILATGDGSTEYTGDGTSGIYIGRVTLKPAYSNRLFSRRTTRNSFTQLYDRVLHHVSSLTGKRWAAAQKFTQTKEL